MEKQERKISLKKLLLTILCTTIVSIFVGMVRNGKNT